MPRRCSVCIHPQLTAINLALVAGEPLSALSRVYRVSDDALARHQQNHITATMARARDAVEVSRGDDLLAQVQRLQRETLSILDKSKANGDNRTALTAIREARGNLELLGRLLGELQAQTVTVNALTISPEWLSIRTAILRAAEPYPEARTAIVTALEAHRANG